MKSNKYKQRDLAKFEYFTAMEKGEYGASKMPENLLPCHSLYTTQNTMTRYKSCSLSIKKICFRGHFDSQNILKLTPPSISSSPTSWSVLVWMLMDVSWILSLYSLYFDCVSVFEFMLCFLFPCLVIYLCKVTRLTDLGNLLSTVHNRLLSFFLTHA